MLLHNKKIIILSLVVFLGLALVVGGCAKKPVDSAAAIEKYPQSTINLLVVHAAGGAGDILARALQPSLQKAIGGNVVIVNVPGGGGNDAYAQLNKAKPDGYTLALAPFPSAILGELTKNGDFHTQEFTYINNVAGNDSNAIYVLADSPYKDLQSLVEAAKTSRVTMAGSGIGTNSHMALTLLEKSANTKFEYVSFESGKGGVIAVAGGHTNAGISNIIDLKDLVDSGKIRILASFGNQRHPKFPDVPTAEELGYKNTGMSVCTGIVGPPNMPPELTKKIADAVDKAVADPDFVKAADGVGTSILSLGPVDFKSLVSKIYAQAETVKDAMKPK
jgi:tripartite-type tricarboxylate transporter receptor subunit TctC